MTTRSGKNLVRIVNQNTRTLNAQAKPTKEDIQTVRLQKVTVVIGYMFNFLVTWSDKLCNTLGIAEGLGRQIVRNYVRLVWWYYLSSRALNIAIDTKELLPVRLKNTWDYCMDNLERDMDKEIARRGVTALSCGWSEYKKSESLIQFFRKGTKYVFKNAGRALQKTAQIVGQKYQVSQVARDFYVPEDLIQEFQKICRSPPTHKPSFMQDVCNSAYNLFGVQGFLGKFGCDPDWYEYQSCQEIEQIMLIKLDSAIECVINNGVTQANDFYETAKVDARYFSSDAFMCGVIYVLLVLVVALLNGTTRKLAKIYRK